MPLRAYQEELVSRVRKAWLKGKKAPCIVLPCGGGKSVIVAEIAKRTTEKHNHVLFLVHRRELCEQIENTFRKWGVDMLRCRVMMVQTAARRIDKMSTPSLIITDENHHSLERLMKELEAETGQYISTEIPRQYKKALDDTYAYFKRNNLQMKRPDMFSHIHSDAVSELANEMRYHINQGISIAGRRVMRYLDTARDNALRQAGLRSAALKAAAGQTVADMQKDLMQRLANDGFLTVQYGTGKRAYQVGLDSYAAMVARSTTREAGNLARENQLTENSYDLMMMTEHYPTCEACAVLQGRVYSISGRDKRFPPLSRAFPSGYRNVHPNCRHVMTYWIEEMQSPEEIRAALARSNAPFTDNRSDEEIALYSKQQADSRRMRADRSQFERYRQRLGEDAPKSFHTFRRIKNADGQKWKDMQEKYRNYLYSQDFDDIIDMKGKMSDYNVRKWYLAHDKKIPDLIDKSLPIEEQAKQACALRNKFRTQARDLMADQKLRKELDISDPNKSFEELLTDKMQRKNLSRDEAIADILKTAVKTRKSVNQKLGLEE